MIHPKLRKYLKSDQWIITEQIEVPGVDKPISYREIQFEAPLGTFLEMYMNERSKVFGKDKLLLQKLKGILDRMTIHWTD